jgi:hypothetical protein
MSIKIRQELPQEWRGLINKALNLYEHQLKVILHGDGEPDYTKDYGELQYTLFDIPQLRAMMKSNVVVELSKDEYENFTSDNGVDFPIFITKTNN